MAHHIFQLENELQNIPEAAPQASRSFSVSEKLARYGSSALSGVETPDLARWKKVRRPCSDSSLCFAQRFGSRFLSRTTAIPSAASG
jgi:hypothetical protein